MVGWFHLRDFVQQSGHHNRLRCEDEPHCSLYAMSPTFDGHLQGLETSARSTFHSEPSIERLNEGVVSWLSRTAEVERNLVRVSPKIKIARDEFTALIDPYRLRM